MAKSKMPPSTRARAKQNKPAAIEVVAKKPAAKKSASVSLQKVIPELEREVKRIAELESDPMHRALLVGQIILTADEIADSIENGFLEGKVAYDSNGAPDPMQSTIAENELPRFLDFIRRALEKTKALYLEQHNAKSPVEGIPAYLEQQARVNFGFYRIIAREAGSPPDWNFWAGLKSLTPKKMSCLMIELDPDKYTNIRTINSPQFHELVRYIDRLEYHAETDNDGRNLSPEKWIKWAQGKGYVVPDKFITAVVRHEKSTPKKKLDSAKKLESVVKDFKKRYEESCQQKQMQPYPIPVTKKQFQDCLVRVMNYGAHIAPESLHDDYLKPLGISFKGGHPKTNILDSLFPADKRI